MTSASKPERIYPQYCFHLSPTINRWCHLRATDIHSLTSHPGFEGQNLFFHVNHPIKWVRIAGIVVAIDEYIGRRVYTVDDSSGATIECVVKIPKAPLPPAPTNGAGRATTNNEGTTATAAGRKTMTGAKETPTEKKAVPIDSDIDVGHVLDVKGGLKVYRTTKQIEVEKIVHLRSTQQEMHFWNKITQLRREVLSKPWKVDAQERRRCRRQAKGSNGETTGRRSGPEPGAASKKTKPLPTGLEKKKKKRVGAAEQPEVKAQYGALGI